MVFGCSDSVIFMILPSQVKLKIPEVSKAWLYSSYKNYQQDAAV